MNEKEPWNDEKHQYIEQQDLILQFNEVEKKLADLKARWPFHSVQPKMVAEREDLEEERDRLLRLINPA
ncbi:hypothetical protein UF75_2820 [Desulfosporosinus sp. I2]|uniref:hypothetical protein n=1 Tax=Desulfosporosinus sp. I2 TaxID=1617025 RepID=UPI0005F01806|nr:hypothetical protein [Desulfosporosinus sp. I2]KJR46763.1 hypothetical protein UF75_2820 [Desulfosporosinus sp. I2]